MNYYKPSFCPSEDEQFKKTIQVFTVKDIAEPADELPPNLSVGEAIYERMGPFIEHALIKDDNTIYGYISSFNGDPDEIEKAYDINIGDIYDVMVKDIAKPITHDILVPQGLPLIKLLNRDNLDRCFFVLSDDSVQDIVVFSDVDKLPAKLCLFTILLEIEAKMTYILSNTSNLDAYLTMLPKSYWRKVRAYTKIDEPTTKKIPVSKLLDYTNLKEKFQMIKEHVLKLDDLGLDVMELFDQNFSKMVKIRNNIAHGESVLSVLDTPEKYKTFVSMTTHINDDLFAINEQQ